jgi:hypothetical protein
MPIPTIPTFVPQPPPVVKEDTARYSYDRFRELERTVRALTIAVNDLQAQIDALP